MRNCFPLEIETILEWNNEWKFEWENRIYLNAPKMSIRIQNESQKNKEKKKNGDVVCVFVKRIALGR